MRITHRSGGHDGLRVQLNDRQCDRRLWQARQASRGAANTKEQEDSDDDEPGKPGASTNSPQKRGGRQPLPRHLKRERILLDLKDEE
ncbi:MAG: hypothetical protein ACJ746_02055 [Bryobacteraceae bacterium]